jgi:WD40 repeat protein
MLGLLLLLLVSGLCLVTCEEAPFEPVGGSPVLKDYSVYFWDGDSERKFYEFHPMTDVLDSFYLPEIFPWYGFQVSADGKYFYVQQSTSFAVVKIETRETIVDLPYTAANGVAVSADNQWIALQGGGLRILRVGDFSVAYEDTTLGIFGGEFSADSKKLYLIGGGSDSTIVVVDVENGFEKTMIAYPSGPSIVDFATSPDAGTMYIIRGGGIYYRTFEALDVATDSAIFHSYLVPGVGDMVVSTSGKYVFITEAGSIQEADGPLYFTIYDSERNRISSLIPTSGIDDGVNPQYMSLGELALTPDGKWLIVGESIGGPSFIKFNTQTMEIESHIITNEGLRNYVCQSGQ